MTDATTTPDTDLPQPLRDLAHGIRGALSALEVDVALELSASGALLMALHPQLNATIAVEIRPAAGGALVTLLLMLADWESARADTAEVERLLGLNEHLMTCAIALVDVGDQPVMALARTLPAAEIRPEEVAERLEEMAW